MERDRPRARAVSRQGAARGNATRIGLLRCPDLADPVLTLCGALLGVGIVLAVVGLLAGSGFVYASLIVTLLVAALLPLGAARRSTPS